MSKAVKLADIGKRLNVSAVTVSKALSGQKGVSEEMRVKIIALAEEMGYMKASREEAAKSYTFGVIVADRYLRENQSFYWKLYQEISTRAIKKNCFTILEVISYDMEREKESPKIIVEQKVDGIIVMGTFKNGYMDYLTHSIEIPFLSLDSSSAEEAYDAVVSNNLMGGYRMTNYLFEMGHKKIGFVGTRRATSSIDDRYFGYLKSLMEHGVSWREDWVLDDRDREYGKIDMENKFVLPAEMPTAFFCNCDLSASFMMKKLNDAGYSIPGDVSIVGFDNFVTDQFGEVGITTYEIDTKEMAKRVVHILLRKLDNAGYSAGMFMVGGTFIQRGSVRQIGAPVPFV